MPTVRDREPGTVDSININALSAAHRRTLQTLRRPVTALAASFGVVREKMADLGPKVVKLYNAIVAENEGFTFVEFARLFDPTVPTHAADRDGIEGYRKHKVYYTLQNMRRNQTTGQRRRGQQGVRDGAVDGFARTIATILQVVADPTPVWDAIQSEFGYGERIMNSLRRRVEATKPLIKLDTAKPAKVTGTIHMERIAPAADEGTQAGREPMAQAGRRVNIPAGGRRRRAA